MRRRANAQELIAAENECRRRSEGRQGNEAATTPARESRESLGSLVKSAPVRKKLKASRVRLFGDANDVLV
jgi:hypothetical protein